MTWGERYDDCWLVIDIMPGLLEAHTGVCFGKVTIPGHRLYAEEWLGRAVYQDTSNYPGCTPEQRLALYAFSLGVEWQRNRKLRKRVEEGVKEGWARMRRPKISGVQESAVEAMP